MDDLTLQAKIDDLTTLYVSPVAKETYFECIDEDSLGGADGYFVVRSSRSPLRPAFEILAKAPSFEAAEIIFDMIVGRRGLLSA